jgi:hypothetical protein
VTSEGGEVVADDSGVKEWTREAVKELRDELGLTQFAERPTLFSLIQTARPG